MGACLAGIGAALVWQLYPGFWKEPPVSVHEVARQRIQALQAAQQQAALATPATVRPAAAPALCELEPLIPPSGAKDGHALVEHPFPGGPDTRAKAFLRQAEESAAQGRLRDTEVALLAACRENDEASARPTVPLARVLGLLGESYASAAAAGAQDPSMVRDQLMARARQALGLSAQFYASALGPNASTSQQARTRLARLEQDFIVAAVVQPPAADPLRDAVVPVRPESGNQTASAHLANVVTVRNVSTEARPPRQRAEPVTQRPEPEPRPMRPDLAFDPELTELASNLARLRGQAEAVSADPVGFNRRADLARLAREQCKDAGCVRDWYRQRRRALLSEF